MTDAHANTLYFDTPARAERLQLLLHLIRNAGEVIYLRAPAGAGKTRFTRRLVDVAGNEVACVWLRGGIDSDVAATVASQLGLAAHDLADWPHGVIRALSHQDLLVVVDDADHLGLAAIERLAALHASGGRLLLVGHGGLAQTTRKWDVHYVDLPPFDPEQSATFLRSNAGDEAEHINDDLAVFLHHAAHGRPGALLDSLEEVLVRARRQAEQRGRRRAGVPRLSWPWLAGGLAVAAIAAVLIFQDSINALFEPAPAPVAPVAGQPSMLAPAPRSVAADDAVTDSAAMAELATPEEPVSLVPPTTSGDESVAMAEVANPGAAMIDSDAPVAIVTPPPIALPELSRLPSLAREIPPTEGEAPPSAGMTSGDDPLEAVMRDALIAAEPPAPVAGPAAVESVAADTTGVDESTSASVAAAAGNSVASLLPGKPPAPTVSSTVSPIKDSTPVATRPAPTGKPSVQAVPGTARVASAPQVERREETAADRAIRSPSRSPGDAVDASLGAAGPAPVEERVASSQAPAVRNQPTPPSAAPVEDRSRAAPSSPAAVGPVEAVSQTTSRTAPSSTDPVSAIGDAWLSNRPSGHYTLQLVGARDRASVEKFIRTHRIAAPYAIFERPLNGRPWYSLVAGDYVDRAAAVDARARLPAALSASDIWPRTFDSIKKSMQ